MYCHTIPTPCPAAKFYERSGFKTIASMAGPGGLVGLTMEKKLTE
jgi:hypothetical protein